MSEHELAERNLAIVRSWFESYASGRDANQRRIREFFDPDADYYPVRKFPEAVPRHGLTEVEAFCGEFWDAWKSWDVEFVYLTAVRDDRVLGHLRVSASGYGSGVNLEGDVFVCCWLRNGRCFRLEDHMTEAGAHRALGLEESG